MQHDRVIKVHNNLLAIPIKTQYIGMRVKLTFTFYRKAKSDSYESKFYSPSESKNQNLVRTKVYLKILSHWLREALIH